LSASGKFSPLANKHVDNPGEHGYLIDIIKNINPPAGDNYFNFPRGAEGWFRPQRRLAWRILS